MDQPKKIFYIGTLTKQLQLRSKADPASNTRTANPFNFHHKCLLVFILFQYTIIYIQKTYSHNMQKKKTRQNISRNKNDKQKLHLRQADGAQSRAKILSKNVRMAFIELCQQSPPLLYRVLWIFINILEQNKQLRVCQVFYSIMVHTA